MSLSSFLTQAPINYAQSGSQTSTALPSWYNDYTQGILQNAAQFANQGYQAYPGPQVAPLNPLQQGAASTVYNQTGVGSGIAQQGVNAANNALAGPNASQASTPYLQAAQKGIGSALQGPNALTASNPYLSAAATPTSSQIGNYLNPYINDVVNSTDALSARNFNENVLPALQDQFSQAGQVYGGTRQGYGAALLGSQEQLNEQMANASLLSSGYNTALQGAQTQAQILGGLGSTAANAGNAVQGNALYGSGLTAGLGSTAGSLANATQQTGLSGAQTLGNLGTTEQNNAISQALAQNAFGTQQQQQQQNQYSTAYQNFLNQTQFPALAAQEMGSALQGIQVPTATTNYSTLPYGQSSTGLQNIAGGAGLGLNLGSLLSGYNPYTGTALPSARGGRIRRSALNDLRPLARGGTVSYLPTVRSVLHLHPKNPLTMR